MEKINANDLADIIDAVKVAVDSSSFGPLFMTPDTDNIMNKQINNIAFQIFVIVLTQTLRKNFT